MPSGELVMQIAGVAQLGLALGSLAIPRVLGWSDELRALRPLTRQVFWVYAAYVLGTNVALGLVSSLLPGPLIAPTPLGRSVAAYAALYWGARLGIQLGYFDRSLVRGRPWLRRADAALTCLFAGLTAIYGAAAAGALR